MKDIQLGDIFYQHKNKVINTAIVALALLIAHNIYQHQLGVMDSLKQQKHTEEQKNIVLENIQQLEKKIMVHKGFINRKDISIAMNLMSELAQGYSINVISIRPEGQEERPLFIKYFFVLKLETEKYHNLGKFISKLESRSELYSVENLKIGTRYSPDLLRKWLSVELAVSTILIKE